MKITIQYKLFFAMLAAAVAVTGYMAVVIQWSFDRGFLEYIDTTEQEKLKLLVDGLEAHYAEHKSWHLLKADPLLILRMHVQTLPEGRRKDYILKKLNNNEIPGWAVMPEENTTNKLPPHPLMRIVVLDKDKNLLYGRQHGKRLPVLQTLYYQNQNVGYIGRYSPQILSDSHQLLFVKKQKLLILLVGVAAVFITVALSLPLAFHLTKPVRRLSEATRKLIAGDYSTRVAVSTNDELGQLSRDINTLAETLAENETQRKLWVSDIAHELRTPLTGLQGEIEAVQDGVRISDSKTFDNLHQGVMRLSRLVEDLYDLSRSDLGILSFFREQVDLRQLLDYEVVSKQGDAEKSGLALTFTSKTRPVIVSGDKQRLQQLIGNLINNSISYTDQGGSIDISLSSNTSFAQLEVCDTAPGVPDEALSKLFKRLFRVEESRNRALGGAGLGLAICQQIVNTHGGSISAAHSPTGGLCIQVTFPLPGET